MLVVWLGLLCFLAYLPSLHGEFWVDDHQSLMAYLDKWKSPWSDIRNHRRPLLIASFWLNDTITKWIGRVKPGWFPPTPEGHTPNPMPYHAMNIVLHWANTVLVVQCGRVIGLPVQYQILLGLIYAIHPLASDAVAAISSRTSLLSGTFFTGAILATLHGWLPLAIVLSVLGVFVKEDMVILPLTCAVVWLIQFHNLWALTFFVLPLIGLVWQWDHLKRSWGELDREQDKVKASGSASYLSSEREWMALSGFTFHLPKWVVGFGFNVDHDIKPLGDAWELCGYLLMVIALYVLHILSPILTALIFLGPASMYIFKTPNDPVVGHRFYTMKLGISLALTLLGRWAGLGFPLIGAVLTVWLMVTMLRAGVWSSALALWGSAIKDGSGNKDRVLMHYANALQAAGMMDAARHWYLKCLEVNPRYSNAYINLAILEKNAGNVGVSEDWYAKGLGINPDLAKYRYILD